MMNSRIIIVLAVSVALMLVACAPPTPQNIPAATPAAAHAPVVEPEAPNTRIVVDVWGREVEIPMNVESIVTLGSGAPRLAAYLGVMHMLVGAEQYIEEGVNIRRDYNPVHHAHLMTLPFVGTGGGTGQNNGFPEEIIMAAPDVIIVGFDLEAAVELQAQTNIPVVSVRHTTGLAPESFREALRIFAEVVGAEERARLILAFIEDAFEDLNNRTYSVPDSEKLRSYSGAITWNGRRGFTGTYANFGPLNVINAYNVSDYSGLDGFFEVDLESVLIWDPDVIFLDPGNMDLVNDEYAKNPAFFHSLRAVQAGRVYTMPAFNNAGTNITYALINAYYAGTVLFPEQFADVDIAEKAGEILTLFLGENIFEIMANDGLFFGQLTIGE